MGIRPSFVRVGFRRIAADSGGGGGVASVTGTAPIHSTGGLNPNISHDASAVTPGSYTNASLTVDAKGHLTAAASGPAPVTGIGVTAPIASTGGLNPTLSHNLTAVTPGSYTNGSFTVDSRGHLTAAASGPAPQGQIVFASSATSNQAAFNFAANTYKLLFYQFQYETGGGIAATNGMVLTGMAASSYAECLYYTAVGGSTINVVNNANANSWLIGGTAPGAPGEMSGWIMLDAAPKRKAHFAAQWDSGYYRTINSKSTDTVNNPTGLVFNLSASIAWSLLIFGWT